MMDTASKLDLIRQSMAGELDRPVYEAIQQGSGEMQSPQGDMPSPQMLETPVAPPSSPSFPTQIYDKKGEMVTPSTSGVGLNQTMGSRSGSMIQPGQYKDGGFKAWVNSLPENLRNTNPEEYNLKGAYEAGLKPTWNEEDKSYHLGSRDPKTGEILKSQWHDTFNEALDADKKLGYKPYLDTKSGKIHTHKEGSDIPKDRIPYSMMDEITVTPQMEELRDQGFDINNFPQVKFPKPKAATGVAPDPSGMSIKQLLKLGKNLPKMMKFAQNNYKNLGNVGAKVKDAYVDAKKTIDLGLFGYGKEKAALKRVDDLKDLTNQLDKAGDIVGPNRYKLMPDSKALKQGLDPDDPINLMRETQGVVEQFKPMVDKGEKLLKRTDLSSAQIKDIQRTLKDNKSILKNAETELEGFYKGVSKGYEDIDPILQKALTTPSEDGMKYFLPGNRNLQTNPLKTPRFSKLDPAQNMMAPKLTPGESVILDQYKNPFKQNKYGGLRYKEGGLKYKEGGPKRPVGKKNITELQKHLTSEGFNVGKAGSDGIWGKDTQAAYDKYTARANNKGSTGYIEGPVKVSQSTQSYFQYLANAALQHYGFVGDKESFFDVDEDDLRRDELTTYKSMLRTNLDNKKKGKIDYRDYSDDPNITNARSSNLALEKLKGKGIKNILIKDALPFQGQGATKEALHALTGNASYTYDSETGAVHVQDNYDFNKSQREVKKTGASLSDIYNQITKGKYDNLWSNAHSAGDHIKSRMPVDINLGSATDLGLTPEEMRSLRKYNPTASGVTKVNMLDMAKNKIMSYFD